MTAPTSRRTNVAAPLATGKRQISAITSPTQHHLRLCYSAIRRPRLIGTIRFGNNQLFVAHMGGNSSNNRRQAFAGNKSIMRILVVEDDMETADYICSSLSAHGHVPLHAADGKEGYLQALDNDFDVMVIDRMLPKLDGLSLVKSIRIADVPTPIIILSAMGGLNDRVEGLEAGADDYLVKPFAFSELHARIAALMRRPPMHTEETVMKVADLELDLVRHSIERAGQAITLQPREYRLLVYLLRNTGKVLTRTMLLEAVWDFHFDPRTNVVETHISRLRNKIDKPFASSLIHTVRGAGYSLHA